MLLYGRCMPRSRTKIIGKTFRNSSAVPNRAFFSITSSVMAKLSFHVYFSNISDTAPNAAITFSTTISFFSFHSFPKFFRRIWDFSFFSSSLSFTCPSPGLTMSMILAFLACLSRKMMSGLLPSTTLSSHCPLTKSRSTLKPSLSTTRSGVCLQQLFALSSSTFPRSCKCRYRATYIIVMSLACCIRYLGYFVLSFRTFYRQVILSFCHGLELDTVSY